MPTRKWPWRRALVTGGSAGIGEAFARQLAAGGCDLVLVARGAPRLEKVAATIRTTRGVPVEILVADLNQRGDLGTVEARLSSLARPIDLLVNNAGGGQLRPFAEFSADDAEAEISLNVVALVRLTCAALPVMLAAGKGHVINVSAGVAFYPMPLSATYSGAKSFVNRFTEALNEELRGTGVGVTAICPGFTRTAGPARAGVDVSKVPRFLWAEAGDVARSALLSAEKDRVVVSPGFGNKLGATVASRIPRRLLLPVLGIAGRWLRAAG